jgi:hypothetical protein
MPMLKYKEQILMKLNFSCATSDRSIEESLYYDTVNERDDLEAIRLDSEKFKKDIQTLRDDFKQLDVCKKRLHLLKKSDSFIQGLKTE